MGAAQEKQINPIRHALFWLFVLALFFVFVWAFKGVLLPFVVGAAIAYLLDPVMEKMARLKIPRWLAALLILILFFFVVVAALVLIMPFAYRELTQFFDTLPGTVERALDVITPYSGWVQEKLGANGNMEAIREAAKNNIGNALRLGGGVVAGIAGGGQALAALAANMVLIPVVAFFMMKEWPRLTAWVDGLLPREQYKTIGALLAAINSKLAGFVRGQLSVAFALALIYSIVLTLAGLDFGFLIGLTAGVLSIIPYVGSTFGIVASLIVAWFQSGGSWSFIGVIVAIFAAGQFVETYFLTPRLVGKSVGLHPLWILFAVMAGGALFGLVGMLLAVPVTAVIGVLIGFFIDRYRASAYYTGQGKGA